MWYFTWILGLGFAVIFALVNALWLESQMERASAEDGSSPPA